MIIDHITKEDLHQFKKELLREIIRLTNGELPEIEETHQGKIQLTISVAQLGVFIRAAIEVGIIKTDNKTSVLKSLIEVISTDKTEKVSLESLRMKMYGVEGSTKERVKQLLMDMFKAVHKY